MHIDEALDWLADRINLEAMVGHRAAPTLDRIQAVCATLGQPQLDQPFVHVTGTNGKGTVTALVTNLLLGRGLTTGTYSSPHLHVVNERIAVGGVPISDDDLAAVLAVVALAEEAAGVRLSYFEALTAAAYRWFSDEAVEAAAVEVGMAGRWDATNVGDGAVAVVTNVSLDHVDYLGADRRGIATEKAGIVKEGAVLVLGETDPDLADVFAATPASETWRLGEHLLVTDERVGVGGRVATIETPGARYDDLLIPLLGARPAAAVALAVGAVEAFTGAPAPPDVVAQAVAATHMPGRLEIAGRHPLVVLDGAHNVASGAAQTAVLHETFGEPVRRRYVVGMLDRDPGAFLEALGVGRPGDVVVATRAPSPRAVAPAEIADAARRLGAEATEEPDPVAAYIAAAGAATAADWVVVTGSLYLVAAIRQHLGLAATRS